MRPPRAAILLACLALAAPAAAAPEAEVFTTHRRPAVAVGELTALDVEVLAEATPDEARGLVRALAAVEPELDAGLDLARVDPVAVRRTGEVVELRRRLWLRASAPGRYAVGGLAVALPGEVAPRALPPREVLAYHAEATERAARHVVEVRVERRVGAATFSRTGSAFLAAPDALVTAYHVISGARVVSVTLPDGSTLRTGRAWRLDPDRDLAVLRVDADRVRRAGLRPLPIAPASADPALVVTAGWSGGEQRRTAARRYPDLALDDAVVRISANPVRPGDSGGPLLDAEGRVVGVVTSGRSVEGDADLLRQDVCLATDLTPVLVGWAERPRRLRAATPDAPAARAVAEAEALLATRPADAGDRTAALLGAARAEDDPLLHFLAGSVLERLGDGHAAAAAYHDASAAGYFPATYALAHHHLRAGDASAAEPLFAEVAATPAYAALGAMGRARALMELGRYADAETELDRVLRHDARFAPALYLLGLVRLSQGRDAAAGALVVRLATHPAWANALRLPVERPALRPLAVPREPLAVMR